MAAAIFPAGDHRRAIAAVGALLQASSQAIGRDQFTIPLTLALKYAEQLREELQRTFEPDALLSRCIAALGTVG